MQSNHQQEKLVNIKSRLFEIEKFQLGKAVEIEGKKFRLSRVTPSNGTITLMVASIFDSRKSLVGGFVRKQYDEYGQVWDKGADLPDAEEMGHTEIPKGEVEYEGVRQGPTRRFELLPDGTKGKEITDSEEKPDVRPGEMGRQVHASGPCAKATDFQAPSKFHDLEEIVKKPSILSRFFGWPL